VAAFSAVVAMITKAITNSVTGVFQLFIRPPFELANLCDLPRMPNYQSALTRT